MNTKTKSNQHTISAITKKQLGKVGKRCFVNCFERASANGGILTEEGIVECDPTVGRNGLGIRCNFIKCIFNGEEGQQLAALLDCANARYSKMPPEDASKLKAKARKLYDHYCNRQPPVTRQ